MKYTEFVKEHYSSVAHLPHKQRLSAIAKMWKKSEHYKAKPAHKKTKAGAMKPKQQKVKSHRRIIQKEQAQGGGIIGTVADLLGLGMKKKGHAKAAHKATHKASCPVCHKMMSTRLMNRIAREIKKSHGGGFADSFLAGLASPFRTAGQIFKPLGFGVDVVADKLGIPTVTDVINS